MRKRERDYDDYNDHSIIIIFHLVQNVEGKNLGDIKVSNFKLNLF